METPFLWCPSSSSVVAVGFDKDSLTFLKTLPREEGYKPVVPCGSYDPTINV